MSETNETPVTVGGLRRWGPLLVGGAFSLAVSAFGWGVAWASFNGRMDAAEKRITVLESAGSPPMRERVERLERETATASAVLRRTANIERFLAHLVCKQWPSDPACSDAIALTPIPE